MYWYTFDDEGGQDWYVAAGEVEGNRLVFPELISVSGGRFGVQVPAEDVIETVVGSAEFIFSGCNDGIMSWRLQRPGQAARSGRANLTRLTTIMGLNCGVPFAMGAPIRQEAQYSGSWTDRNHPGEGFALQVLRDARVAVYWFGFDTDGNRRWFFGVGEPAGGVIRFDDMMSARGGRFGSETKPDTWEVFPWGSLTLELNCDGGKATYEPTEPGFPPGEQQLIQLTSLPGLEC
jgi:hypothetical protein